MVMMVVCLAISLKACTFCTFWSYQLYDGGMGIPRTTFAYQELRVAYLGVIGSGTERETER